MPISYLEVNAPLRKKQSKKWCMVYKDTKNYLKNNILDSYVA